MSDTAHEVDVLLDADDLAVIFKTHRRRVMEWQLAFGWPRIKIGKEIRWTPEQVEQIKRTHTVTAAGVTPADGRTARSARKRA